MFHLHLLQFTSSSVDTCTDVDFTDNSVMPGTGGGGRGTVLPNGVKTLTSRFELNVSKMIKSGFNMQFAFILNGFGQKMNN